MLVKNAFPLRGRCPSSQTGADEVEPAPSERHGTSGGADTSSVSPLAGDRGEPPSPQGEGVSLLQPRFSTVKNRKESNLSCFAIVRSLQAGSQVHGTDAQRPGGFPPGRCFHVRICKSSSSMPSSSKTIMSRRASVTCRPFFRFLYSCPFTITRTSVSPTRTRQSSTSPR